MGFGFLDITLVDIIDIFVVALIMFQVYRLTRGHERVAHRCRAS